MKFTGILALAASVSGHAIFQEVSVNGASQGQLRGVRAPSSNYPIEDVNDSGFACNKNIQYRDNNVISIPAGARVGAKWGHIIGGAQGSNDPDNPIAASHKGPIIYYLAKVSNAAGASEANLNWFKVGEEGLNNGRWAVDTMISGGGWHYFTMPSCVAAGDYLLRVELIALHNGSKQGAGGAQFYMGCAQVRVTGGGSSTGSSTIRFPGGYSSTHPGILISIYGTGGTPNNGGRAYSIPGPALLTCSGSPPPTTQPPPPPTTQPPPPTTQPPPPTGNPPPSGCASLYGQCGGTGFSGPTCCSSGTCKVSNQWYSQCL